MTISLHIEQLTIEGLPLPGADRKRVLSALQQRLSRLLAEVPATEWRPMASGRVGAASVQLASQDPPSRWGQQVAEALWAAIATATRDGAAPENERPVHEPAGGK